MKSFVWKEKIRSLKRFIERPMDEAERDRDTLERRTKEYRRVIQKYEECNAERFRFYKLTNAFRAPTEALVTLYLMILYILFKDVFLYKNPSAETLIVALFMPFVVAAFVCVVYTLAVTILVNRWSTKMVSMLVEDKKGDVPAVESYKKVDYSFFEKMLLIHIGGIIAYGVVSYVVGTFYSFVFADYLMNNVSMRRYLVIWGLFFGIVWNVSGFFSDMRIDWSKIFFILKGSSVNVEEIGVAKHKYYQLAKYSQLMVCMVVLVLILRIASNPRDESIYIFVGENASGSIPYILPTITFLTFFASTITLYIKYTYRIYYSRYYSENSTIFPLPKDFM